MTNPDRQLLGQRRFTALTFDCYGTLVDWERGACAALRRLLPPDVADLADDTLVQRFLTADRQLTERGLMPYAEVLAQTVREIAEHEGIAVDPRAARAFAASVPSWPLFEETNPVLEQLSRRYRLAIISNIDERLIAETLKGITVSFDVVMTSERAQTYKPDRDIFTQALSELDEPPEQVLHVAEGLCEATPARALGMGSVWVRRSDRSDDGSGAEPHAQVGCLAELVPILCPDAPMP